MWISIGKAVKKKKKVELNPINGLMELDLINQIYQSFQCHPKRTTGILTLKSRQLIKVLWSTSACNLVFEVLFAQSNTSKGKSELYKDIYD